MKCFICGNTTEFKKLFPELCTTKNYLCHECGLVFVPRRESLQEYYKEDGYYKRSPNRGLRKGIISKALLEHLGKTRLQEITKRFEIDWENKKVLDVGCGYGHLLHIINEKFGSEVTGLEPSEEIARVGRDFFNVDIVGDILENYQTGEKFDIILCNHTLEHVDDPGLFLDSLKNRLEADGILYIEVPNVLRPTGNFTLNEFLYHEHLQTFSAYNLELLFNKFGLQVLVYSDDKFLMFVLEKEKNPKSLVSEIGAGKIEKFLFQYHKNYGLIDRVKVYFNKFKYLLKALYFKVM